MRIHCGTSGFSYPSWRGSFYPERARISELLSLYAARLPAVEINATFYRMPTAAVLAGWRRQVGPAFRFALKGPQRITHVRRLREAAGETAHFHAVAEELGPSLGPVLWQLPPHLQKDLPRLEAFLGLLPAGGRPAFEFRHQSWYGDDVYDALSAHGAALVTAHDGEHDRPLVATARFGYLRLRAAEYDPQALRQWAGRVIAQPWDEAFLFFKHEEEGKGAAFALAMMEALGERAVRVEPSAGDEPPPYES